MKFGDSLSEGLVPEWENQYVDYKLGKKLIKRYALLQKELERENIVDTTPLLEPIGEEVSEREYFYLNGKPNSVENGSKVKHYNSTQGVSHRNDYHLNSVNSVNPGNSPNLANSPNQANLSTPNPVCNEDGSNGRDRKSSIFQFSSFRAKPLTRDDVAEEGAKFSLWLDEELQMVNSFYKDKERDVYHRFLILEDQFAQLKEHKLQVQKLAHSAGASHMANQINGPVNKNLSRLTSNMNKFIQPLTRYELPSLPSTTFLKNFRSNKDRLHDVALQSAGKGTGYDLNYEENRIRNGESNFDAQVDAESISSDDANLPTFQSVTPMAQSNSEQFRISRKRDFATSHFEVPYPYAKKVLKDALVEHYRSVALVRSYRTMNRTALRKITKKFDKATGSSISADFMKTVDNLYFQTSTVLEQILGRVEDLFLSFYDSGNDSKKHGLEKLKSATYTMQPHLYHGASFVSGLFLGSAVPLLAIVIYLFTDKLKFQHQPKEKYLGEVWGGFFLVIVAFILVAINFYTYSVTKINYKFIFEFNLATALDFRQFLVLPSVALAFLGFCSWFSWSNFWPDSFPGRDWPLIFLGVVLIIFLWPGTQFYASSRRWLQVAIWRICWSGFYPVEFRDFYLGDIFCSLTYSLSNLSFFICLYGVQWRHYLGGGSIPDSTKFCGSGYSRSMGFLSALPSIWRFLQCLRRYMDTGDLFPHLANMMKYFVGACYYCFLSLWRIDKLNSYRALFITFASVNSVFTSAWDIFMDWSLLQPGSKHFLLRDELFFEKPIFYYLAMIQDVCFRFLWVIYIALPGQLQQLALTSFCLAVAELFRRFIWMFFRMENEHRTNVTLFRASRDLPLPYHLSRKVEAAIDMLVNVRYLEVDEGDEIFKQAPTRNASLQSRFKKQLLHGHPDVQKTGSREEETGFESPGLFRRSTIGNISAALNKAHIKDFQRRKHSLPGQGVDSDEEDVDVDEDIKSLDTSGAN